MVDNIIDKTKKIAEFYFKGITDEKPYDLWRSFDKSFSKDLSVFITGKMYSRNKIPHTTRQLVTISALTVLGKSEELSLHIHAAINVGCTPFEISEVIFQTFTYGGIPNVNNSLKVLRNILKKKGMWPITNK